jgi:transcriptional regulator with XRE-family HTH domain
LFLNFLRGGKKSRSELSTGAKFPGRLSSRAAIATLRSNKNGGAVVGMLGRGRSPQLIDLELGGRIRLLRTGLGMSQTELGKRVGISFHQIQKYERGFNRVSVSMLVEIARALDSSLHALTANFGGGEAGFDKAAGALGTPGAADMLAAYAALRSQSHRRAVIGLARSLAKSAPPKQAANGTATHNGEVEDDEAP